jgi:hypothetical protein
MKARIALLLPLVVLAAGCGGSSGTPPPSTTTSGSAALSTYRNSFLEFRYPQAWRTLEFPNSGELHFHPMLYLSTQPGHDPCRQTGLSVTCDWPVDRLQTSGVVALWENRGYPGWTLATQQGTRVVVGGRPARQQIARPGSCRTIGGDETVSVEIARPLQSNWTAFTACLRGPNLAAHERQVAVLLASTRFRQP